jgi:cysteine desulfurase
MIYLDNSATTRPYPEVTDSFVKVSNDYFGNPSSLHSIGSKAELLLTKARENIAKLLNVKISEIIFTASGTEGNNMAIKGAAIKNKHRGKHIITTTIEHPSVSNACLQLEGLGFEITYLPVNKSGVISIEDLKNAIRPDTTLVSIIHVNNEVGSIQPIFEIGQILKQYPKILFHVDHVQGICKVPLSLHEANIDLCTMSAHKFHGLKGNGLLFIRSGVTLEALLAGGGQEMGFRSSTENVAGIIAMAKALRMTMDLAKTHLLEMVELKKMLMDGFTSYPFVTLNTPVEQSAPHIINFSLNGLKSEVFVHALEEKDIYVSTTSACSSKKKQTSKTLVAMGINKKSAESSIRISLSYENKLEEVPVILNAVYETIKKIKEVMR